MKKPSRIPLSVVIPVHNDAAALGELLPRLSSLQAECLIVDGASSDNPAAAAGGHRCTLLHSPPNRGAQLALGAETARGDWLWLLHADCVPDEEVLATVRQVCSSGQLGWGRFDVRLEGRHPLLPIVAWLMNRRSCATGICTGDQGLLVRRCLLDGAGGVPPLPLMEDIELSKRLRRFAAPWCFRARLRTSARRWERQGMFRTITRMWWFRWRYFAGASPETLRREYYAEVTGD